VLSLSSASINRGRLFSAKRWPITQSGSCAVGCRRAGVLDRALLVQLLAVGQGLFPDAAGT